MKAIIPFLAACLAVCSCSRRKSPQVREGVIYSVAYKDGDGKVHGFTRLDQSTAVPGGNGSWNVDAYGQLTSEFLIITRPQRHDLGPQVIPVHNLVAVQV